MIWKATHSSIKHEVKKKVNAVKRKSYCMARQEKFEHKMFLVLWPSLSLHCVLRICVMHRPDLPHQQKYLLSRYKEHHSSVSKTTPQR